MKRPYISGPMSSLPDLNFPAFNAETARLRALGFDVVNPAELNADAASTWADCMRVDIAALVTCDGLVLLPGSEASRGARLERHIAEQLGMPVTRCEYITHGPAQCPGLTRDPRYQLDPAAVVDSGFAAAGIGRYVDGPASCAARAAA